MRNTNWTAENIPDQKGKTAIVTGSSSGIGYEAARVLANKRAAVIIAVRNPEKGSAAAQRILGQNKDADIKVMELDLANLESVANFAANFKKAYSRLDLLINNAGVMIPPYAKTADGFELQFGTNHLGHFALTGRLLDLLANTEGARIVNVSSSAHKWGNIDFDDLTWEKRGYSAWRAYGDSKIANLYFTFELDRRLREHNAGTSLLTTAAHPGWTATELQRHMGLTEFLNTFMAMDISQGGLPTLRAAVEDNLKGGEFFGPGGFVGMWGYPVQVTTSARSKDEAIAKKLWDVSEQLTGVNFDFNQKARSAGK